MKILLNLALVIFLACPAAYPNAGQNKASTDAAEERSVEEGEQDYEFFVKSELAEIAAPNPEIEVPQIPKFKPPQIDQSQNQEPEEDPAL